MLLNTKQQVHMEQQATVAVKRKEVNLLPQFVATKTFCVYCKDHLGDGVSSRREIKQAVWNRFSNSVF